MDVTDVRDSFHRAAYVKWAIRLEQLCLDCEAAKSEKRTRTMNKTIGILCALCLMLIWPASGNGQSPESSKLQVAIHYTAQRGDSMDFIPNQLRDPIAEWWSVTDLKLYPFGKAVFHNDSGKMEVHCQSGEDECELNALHACVIETLEPREAFEMINCMSYSYSNKLDPCARKFRLNVSKAKECKSSRSTFDILEPYGRETLKLNISHVPTIVFENNFAPNEQHSLRTFFRSNYCVKYNKKFNIILPDCSEIVSSCELHKKCDF